MVANSISRDSVRALVGISRMVAVDYSAGDAVLAEVSRALSCNVDGTVVMTLEDAPSTSVTRVMIAGQDYAWRVHTIKNAGTSVGMGIHALY